MGYRGRAQLLCPYLYLQHTVIRTHLQECRGVETGDGEVRGAMMTPQLFENFRIFEFNQIFEKFECINILTPEKICRELESCTF